MIEEQIVPVKDDLTDIIEGHASNQEGIEVYYGDLDNKEKYVNTLRKYVSTGSILDVGCGQGEFLGAASKYFDTCCGIEPHLYKKKNSSR